MRRPLLTLTTWTLLVALQACGGGKTEQAPEAAPAADGGLTAFQLENGIGPVTEAVVLGPVDPALAGQGKQLFEGKCAACHKMGERYVGPALGEVTTRRTPAYILNMVLNPEGMYTRHPVARQLLAEHMTQMPNLALSQDEARQVLEYLRTQATPKSNP
jgi:mono/diheme cytochrome c family protein